MGTLIDTSVLIAVERRRLDPAQFGEEDEDEPIAIAAISAAELLHGVNRLKSAVGRMRAERWVDHTLAQFPCIAFDLPIARIHARLGAELAEKGTQVGAHDLMIAATAVWLDYRIATRDLRSFPKIRGLDVVKW